MKITKSELKQIIKEEAERFVKIKTLESQKENIKNQINEMYTEESVSETVYEGEDSELEEGVRGSKYDKAISEWKTTHKAELDKLNQAHQSYSPEYLTISADLVKGIRRENGELARKHGIPMQDANTVLFKELMLLAEPTKPSVFKQQAERGGASMGDVAAGASSGRQAWTNENSMLNEGDIRNIVREESEKIAKAKSLEEKAKSIIKEMNDMGYSIKDLK